MKVITGIALTALLMGTLMLAFNVQQTESSEPPATEWTRTYRGEDSESAVAVVETSDGGYALAGDTTSFGAGGTDFWLVKVDSLGNMEWNQTYGGADTERAFCVVETSDGGYALAGQTTSFGAGSADFWLVKVAGRPTHGDELGLLVLGIGLTAAALVVAVATTIYVFIKRARTLKNSTISACMHVFASIPRMRSIVSSILRCPTSAEACMHEQNLSAYAHCLSVWS